MSDKSFFDGSDPRDLIKSGFSSGGSPGKGAKNVSGNDSRYPLRSQLEGAMDFDRVFRIVKKSVRDFTGKERSGLGLALSDLQPTLGAFWQLGGNYIVMNENLIEAMAKNASSFVEFNSYIYMILTHEYIHSLGFTDEMEARQLTASVARRAFGEDHPAYIMSAGDVWTLYPFLRNAGTGTGKNLRIISNFDSSSTSYIG